jgi:hypothetical protein
LSFRNEDLELFANVPIEQAALAPAFHLASGGSIGVVVQLLDGARRLARRRGRKVLVLDDLVDAFARLDLVWDTKPRFNPFSVKQLPANWSAMAFDTGTKS